MGAGGQAGAREGTGWLVARVGPSSRGGGLPWELLLHTPTHSGDTLGLPSPMLPGQVA